MLKRRILKLAVAAVVIASAIGLASLGATAASAATARSATTSAQGPAPRTVITRQGSLKVTAEPDTVSSCTYGSSSGNIHTCFGIVGSYSYVDYMWASACVSTAGRTLHLEITGPSFRENSAQEYVGPGQCLDFDVYVYADVTPGAYSGITWRYNGGTSYTNVGKVTRDVVA